MTRDRLFRLADWLDREAMRELGTAEALEKLEHADPMPCRVKARLFFEIATILREEACRQEPSVETKARTYQDRRD